MQWHRWGSNLQPLVLCVALEYWANALPNLNIEYVSHKLFSACQIFASMLNEKA